VATRKLEVVITGDASSLEKAFGKAGNQGKSFAKTMGKAGVAGAIVGLGAAVKIGVDEFMEAQRVTAQTNAVLKSTGGVAGTTTKQIQNLSESLMKKSGVDDEAIQSGQNMLLTFTKIRNETGKGNDVFDQATKATLNLSVAMKKDMQSSAVLVGKALNDPIKGIGALYRVGVQLTQDQKDTIKEMVRLGDTAGAQKVILKELETQFGGSAAAAGKTFSGGVNIAKQTLMNFAGQGVAAAMPKLQEFAGWFVREALPKIQQLVDFLTKTFVPVIKGLVGVFRDALSAIGRLLEENKTEIQKIVNGVKTVLKGIALVFEEVIFPLLKFYFKDGGPFDIIFSTAIKIISGVIRAIEKIVDVFKTVKTWVAENWPKVAKIIEESPFVKTFMVAKDAVESLVGWLKDAFNWVKKLADLPGIGLLGKLTGDPIDPNFVPPTGFRAPVTGSVDLRGALPIMAPFGAAAAGYGLSVTSGLRPGARTANGTLSDHALGKALDVSGSAAGMAGFFRSLIGNPAVKQAFYDPLGSIFGGLHNMYREGGHSDHVHVATYDKGGILKPGWTMAYNGTGRNEYVNRGGAGTVVNVYGDVTGTQLVETVRREINRIQKQNSRTGYV
jgi:hypothetical protein